MRKISFWLTVFVIFTLPWENIRLFGFGSSARVAGLVMGAFWIVTVLFTGKIRRLRPFHLVALVFVFWNLLSLLWSVDVSQTIDRLSTYGQLFLMTWIIWDLFTTSDKVRIGLQAYVLGAYVSLWSTISNYLSGVTTNRNFVRYTGFGFNENVLAFILSLGIPVAWYLAISASSQQKQNSKVVQLLNYAYLPLAIFSILLTANRTALFSIIPALWFVLASIPRLRIGSRIMITAGLMGALFFLQPLIPQTSLERLATVEGELGEDGDIGGRTEIWNEAMESFWERPLTGYGSGTFKTAVGFKDKASHSLFVNLFVETGLTGFLLFAATYFLAAYHVRYHSRWEASFWLSLFAVWAIGNFTSGWENRKQTWVFFALIVSSANVEMERARHLISSSSKIRSAQVVISNLWADTHHDK